MHSMAKTRLLDKMVLMRWWLLLVCILCSCDKKTTYNFIQEPIDVVIPCIRKDRETLELCIEGIRNNGQNIRRIIVVSPERMTENAEWFDENNYPFTKEGIACAIFQNPDEAKAYLLGPNRIGWIYQQLLKLYAPLVIPGISSNVLVLDADTIFLNPVSFVDPSGHALFAYGSEYYGPYFSHAKKLIPGFKKVYPDYSGIAHHMLFQKCVIEDLFRRIETGHRISPWKALCRCISRKEAIAGSPLSEYEIYFNFICSQTDQRGIRPLQWTEIQELENIDLCRQKGYHFVSRHVRD